MSLDLQCEGVYTPADHVVEREDRKEGTWVVN